MYPIKKVETIFTIAIFLLCSCGSKLKALTNIYGKELVSPQGPLFSPSRLIVYQDYTFEYSEGGPALKYSKGKWKLNKGKRSITLETTKVAALTTEKQLIDTIFIDMNYSEVRIINNKSVKIGHKMFYLKKKV